MFIEKLKTSDIKQFLLEHYKDKKGQILMLINSKKFNLKREENMIFATSRIRGYNLFLKANDFACATFIDDEAKPLDEQEYTPVIKDNKLSFRMSDATEYLGFMNYKFGDEYYVAYQEEKRKKAFEKFEKSVDEYGKIPADELGL